MLLTCLKLPFVIKFFVLSIFEWPVYTGSTEKLLYTTCIGVDPAQCIHCSKL